MSTNVKMVQLAPNHQPFRHVKPSVNDLKEPPTEELAAVVTARIVGLIKYSKYQPAGLQGIFLLPLPFLGLNRLPPQVL
jgi:hypothetical protein